MKVYYAHCLAIYKTPQETRDIDLLKGLGFEILNPNSPESELGYRQFGMQYFCNLIYGCEVLAFRALPDGSIPAGIGEEIKEAKRLSKLIIELPSCVSVRIISVEETREYLAEAGQR